MKLTFEKKLLFSKVFVFVLGIAACTLFTIHFYDEFMLQTTEQTPINDLPSVKGKILSIDNCTPTKQGWINRVKLQQDSGNNLQIYTPCLSNFYHKDFFIGKTLTSIHEKFNFPTFRKEHRIFLTIDSVVIEEVPNYRKLPLKEKSIDTAIDIIKIPAMTLAFTLLIAYFFYTKISHRLKTGYKLIDQLRSNAENAFNSKNDQIYKIISKSDSFNSTPKYSDAIYSLEIYYKTADGLYWKFKSDGQSHKTIHIPNDIAKIKWPNSGCF